MIDTKGIYKIDLSRLPKDCAISNMPRIASGDIVVIIEEDTSCYKYFKKLGVKCYRVKVVLSSFPRRSKDRGAIGYIPELILVPHKIDLATDQNHIKPSIMYKTKR